MKLPSRLPLRTLAVAGLAVFSVAPVWAVIPFAWVTNGSGVVTDGSWTGDGTIQNNLNPASTTAQIAVQDFSLGTIGIDSIGGNASGNIYSAGRILTNPITATQSISLTGGTADLRLHNSNSFDGGGALFNSVGLTDFQGVTEISWTLKFSEPIAGRNETLADLTTRPMGAGLALITAGTGQSLSSFTVDMEFGQIYHEDTLNDVFLTGVPTAAVPRQATGFGTAVAGATSFTSSAFSALNQFLLVRGYDYDGVGGYTAADAELVYMTEMTWTIRRDDGLAFASNTLFTMSMDGQQYANVTEVIPEPTSLMLMAGSVLGGCLFRRRRD